MKFEFGKLEKYIHDGWEEYTLVKKQEEDKHYFVHINLNELQEMVDKIENSLKIRLPKELCVFYEKVGTGYFWVNNQHKVGIYNMLSPDEIYDLYYPDEEEDWFSTYRKSAWDNLKAQLIAFCVFGEEDSLLYYNLNNGGIYYLSNKRIANSFDEFLNLIDNQVDYFV